MNSSLSSVTINDSESFGGMIQRERTDSMVSVGERDVNFPTLENQNELLVYQRMNVRFYNLYFYYFFLLSIIIKLGT